MQIQRLSPNFGAEVHAIDLNQISDEQFAQIEKAFLDHQLLVFKKQALSPAAQIDFSRRFGELDVHVLTQYNHPQHEEIFVLSNVVENGKPIGISDGGSYWHSDFAFQERPASATILNAQQIPEQGGQTLFIDMYQAYEDLSQEYKQRLQGLQAIHRYRSRRSNQEAGTQVKLNQDQEKATPDMVHPVVRTHVQTGRKALFVHPGMAAEIVGLSEQESNEILSFLFDHSTQEKYQYAFSWTPGDVVMWDNRCTMHKATTRDLPAHMHRTIFRTTVRGERPV
ncbi:TauD/TfdA dioxygenase family protein [Alcaligenes endophyticus]|uniref:TauD/TfdA family dioxygenase n=1 Tax=Alcaligenes endophyticus TaxID=1929088 RepID=A0ABT8EL03_9BURK|nr:TauD/TfdA family dioxygenase [Alcaligenes endophyticus]MCX5590663.1 TauD/TfdA family dioxygenase [Alcaligenes endophyticus]MDN4121973.1 TauD/TfdA family dioxygenase [Alcaligenes endophyticus]